VLGALATVESAREFTGLGASAVLDLGPMDGADLLRQRYDDFAFTTSAREAKAQAKVGAFARFRQCFAN